jgi:hypothetical protein
MLVIPVNKVVERKESSEKMEGRGGGEAQGNADPTKKQTKKTRDFRVGTWIALYPSFWILGRTFSAKSLYVLTFSSTEEMPTWHS